MPEFWETDGVQLSMGANNSFPICVWCLIHHLNLIWWKCPQKKASSISSHSSCLSFISVSLFKFSPSTARQSAVLFHRMTDAHTRPLLCILTRLWTNMSNLISVAYVTKPFFETTSDSLCPRREKHKHQLQGKAMKSGRCDALSINIF